MADPDENSIVSDALALLLDTLNISPEVDPASSFLDSFRKVKKDARLLREIQERISQQVELQAEKEKALQRKYSRLSGLPKGIQMKIVTFMDAECLWVFEESNLLDLGSSREEEECVENQWETLENQPAHKLRVPKHLRERPGVVFGKVSRFARKMEKAARHFYENEALLPNQVKDWPEELFQLKNSNELWWQLSGYLFVRVAYRAEDSVEIFDGFYEPCELYDDDNPAFFKIELVGIDEASSLSKAWSKCFDRRVWGRFGDWIEDDEALQMAEDIANRLTITLLVISIFKSSQLIMTPEDDNIIPKLVLSSSGFGGTFPYGVSVKRRSPMAADRDWNETEYVQASLKKDPRFADGRFEICIEYSNPEQPAASDSHA